MGSLLSDSSKPLGIFVAKFTNVPKLGTSCPQTLQTMTFAFVFWYLGSKVVSNWMIKCHTSQLFLSPPYSMLHCTTSHFIQRTKLCKCDYWQVVSDKILVIAATTVNGFHIARFTLGHLASSPCWVNLSEEAADTIKTMSRPVSSSS